jgi:hypothetical protein
MNVGHSKKIVSLEFIIETIQNSLQSDKFLTLAKKTSTAFTRKRKLPLLSLVICLLSSVKTSTSVAIQRLIFYIKNDIKQSTQQAFSKARQNLRWQALRLLFDDVVNAIYTGSYQTWHGFRLLAIDGTKIQLPSDPKLRKLFGTLGSKDTAATAQASTLYDVLNKIIVDAIIGPMSTGERTMAMQHLDYLKNNNSPGIKNLVLFDRGYASFELIRLCFAYGITFVMRLKSKFNCAIDKLPLGCHNFILCQGDEKIKIRVIKFRLSDGKVETLITNLFDYNLGQKAFKELYAKRWSIEVKYASIKHGLDVENFSSRTEEGIYQDFYVTVLLNNIITVGTWEAQDIVDENNKNKQLKYKYQVNFNQAIGTFKDSFIMALLLRDPLIRAQSIREIIKRLVSAVTPKRPGRTIQRNPNPRRANFHHNQKSNC